VIGTQTTPTAKPCTALLATRISMVTLRSKVSIHSPAAVCRPKPIAMLMRGSIRLMKPATRKPTSIPAPRHPITWPTSASEKPICCCSSGGSSTIGVKFSMP
jgi:hypothetical protein